MLKRLKSQTYITPPFRIWLILFSQTDCEPSMVELASPRGLGNYHLLGD